MFKGKIVRGDIFEIKNGKYIIITSSKKDALEGQKFNIAKPRDFHDNKEQPIKEEDLIEKWGHISLNSKRKE